MKITTCSTRFCVSLKATLAHAEKSSDKYIRPQLQGVNLETVAGESNLYVAATNGHTLSVVTLDVATKAEDSFSALVPFEACKRLVNLYKLYQSVTIEFAELGGVTISGENFPDYGYKFPPWRNVIPALDRTGGIGCIGIDPKLLKLACDSLTPFTTKAHGAKMRVGGELDPIRFDAEKDDLGSITVVVMPMRI